MTVTNDFATVEATHDSEELKSAMQNAGVVGASTIWRHFLCRPTQFRRAPLGSSNARRIAEKVDFADPCSLDSTTTG
jgi:hypothetical protein